MLTRVAIISAIICGAASVSTQPLAAQTITTVAGNGAAMFSGDGGPAPSASLNHPRGLAVAADGSVYIVPLRIGGGTRLKIFEAMSMAKAVVSTTVGAEGLPVTHGHDIVIADEPARFAQTVVHLIRDAELRGRIETEARRLVVDRYDWSAVAEDFEDALTRLQRAGVAA